MMGRVSSLRACAVLTVCMVVLGACGLDALGGAPPEAITPAGDGAVTAECP